MRVARVAIDVPLTTLFDYLVPAELAPAPGDRVVVPFGRTRRIGVVVELAADTTLPADKLRSVTAVRDDAPHLPPDWLDLMRFLATYYQRPLGETVISSLPPRLRAVRPLPGARRRRTQAPVTPQTATSATPAFRAPHALSADQQAAVAAVEDALGTFRSFVLYGVTGSGKTEVYLHLAAEVAARGGQTLVLVPEISLTPQLEARFRSAFPGTTVAVMHSGLEDTARTDAWLAAVRGEARIILGTRLAVLAPLPRLELVVVDEEHDPSFKQQDGLRYSGRDVAVMRAKLVGCPVILGSATPSLESWHHCDTGRYARLDLPLRAAPGSQLPTVRVLDLSRETLDHGFAKPLLDAITLRLARGEQSLIFINRRGYAPVLACPACGWAAGCERCTGHLVLHAVDRRLRCHHCGAESGIPRACPTCGNVDLKPLGRGTQRVEEFLATRFPDARIMRIDRDSARRRKTLIATLESIRRGEHDILVGTQLLAKGHDFPGLSLVGVLNADSALFSTDYRAAERLYATLAQVAGRAGRREQQGEVLVQSRFGGHPLFRALVAHDFSGFAAAQLEERRTAGFPPFAYEAVLRAESAELKTALEFLTQASTLVSPPAGVELYDPVPHVVTRRAGLERARLLAQSPSRAALQGFLTAWNTAISAVAPRNVRWHLEVDPIEFD